MMMEVTISLVLYFSRPYAGIRARPPPTTQQTTSKIRIPITHGVPSKKGVLKRTRHAMIGAKLIIPSPIRLKRPQL